MNLLQFLIEPFSYEFMQRALIVSLSCAIVCAVLSCWLVLIGWSLLGDAISHSVLPGVVLAYIIGIPFSIGALTSALLAVSFIGSIKQRTRIKEDASMGIVFTTFFAAGLVLISITPADKDLNHIIFGNVLGVDIALMWQILVLAALILTVLLVKRRDFTLYAFDPVHARTIGINPRFLYGLLLLLVALTSVIALQVVGVVLVVAMLITPGASAYLLTKKFSRMLLIAPALACSATIVGTYISYYQDTATGPTIVVSQGVLFLGCYLWSLKPTNPNRLHRNRPQHDGIGV